MENNIYFWGVFAPTMKQAWVLGSSVDTDLSPYERDIKITINQAQNDIKSNISAFSDIKIRYLVLTDVVLTIPQ